MQPTFPLLVQDWSAISRTQAGGQVHATFSRSFIDKFSILFFSQPMKFCFRKLRFWKFCWYLHCVRNKSIVTKIWRDMVRFVTLSVNLRETLPGMKGSDWRCCAKFWMSARTEAKKCENFTPNAWYLANIMMMLIFIEVTFSLKGFRKGSLLKI